MELPEKLLAAVSYFHKLPGIGEKTALRHILGLTHWQPQELEAFAQSLRDLTDLRRCDDCGMFSDEELCTLCSSGKRRDSKTLCVVESVTDCLAIEKSGHYKGLFHVLGGVLNPLRGIGPEELNINKLFNRIKDQEIEVIILAVNPSVEGDATCSYIRQQLSSELRVERIGFGVPIGGSLEYLDPLTISKALENRQAIL